MTDFANTRDDDEVSWSPTPFESDAEPIADPDPEPVRRLPAEAQPPRAPETPDGGEDSRAQRRGRPTSAVVRRRRAALIAGAVGLALIVFLIARGDTGSGTTFGAEEFTAGVSENGVEITLGGALLSDDQSKEVYGVTVEPLEGAPVEGGSSGPLNGSLAVYDDVAGADGGLTNCEAAGEFVCYQAQNVVLIIEGGGLQAQRLGVAIRRFAESR